MLQIERDMHCIGLKAASSFIARTGGPPWFWDVSALEDCIKRNMGPKADWETDDGVPVFSKADLVRFMINTFGAEADRKEMLDCYFGGDGHELIWRPATGTVVLVDFNDDVFR